MAKTSPTQRTLALLRKHFKAVQIVERWNQWARVRQDLFGVIDIVACCRNTSLQGLYGVQCTSGTNHSARVTKAKEEPRLKCWLLSGGKFLVISWDKKGKRGERKTWKHRCTEISIDYPLPASGAEQDVTFTIKDFSSIEEKFQI